MPARIDAKGLKQAQGLMKMLESMGGVINSVELLGHQRKEKHNLDNAEIFDYLAEGGRDFGYKDEETINKIGNVLADELERGLAAKSKITNSKSQANNIMAKAFKAAGQWFAKLISRRINDGDWHGDGGELNPQYAEYKKKKFGFEKPIGKATGQLFDNLNPTSANLKLKRK